MLPHGTCLTLQVTGQDAIYVCYVVGPGRYGLRTTPPMILTQVVALPASTELQCAFALNNSWWEFKSSILGYEQTNPPIMVLATPTEILSATRRKYLRHRAELQVSYLAEAAELVGEHTYTINLSAGGLQMATSLLLPRGTKVSMQLNLGDQVLGLSGLVVWSSFRGKQPYAGIQFTDLTGPTEQILMRFLMELERLSARGAG